jgi:hypothetical protein
MESRIGDVSNMLEMGLKRPAVAPRHPCVIFHQSGGLRIMTTLHHCFGFGEMICQVLQVTINLSSPGAIKSAYVTF